MSNILSQAIDWIGSRPYWEQFAFKRIIDGKEFTDETYDELIQFCLEDAGLEETLSERKNILWTKNEASLSASECVKIIQLSNLQNVNALAKDQTLNFHPNLTVIYGANGSGKSGYSRMLAYAGFSRGDSTIHPDVMKAQAEGENISFDLVFSVGNAQQAVTFVTNEQNEKLYSLYVFDSLSVVRHLTKSEKISFSPSGLIHFSRLGEVVNKCIEKLDSKTQKYFEPHRFENFFPEQAEVRRAIADNDFTKLKTLSKLNKDELQRLDEVTTEISRLRIESVTDKIKQIRQVILDLTTLIQRLINVENVLTSEIEEINSEINQCIDLQSKIEDAGTSHFESKQLSNIGSPEWNHFINAAKSFAQTQRSNYPVENDECLLCHQTLSQNAQVLLRSLWDFLEADLQTKLIKVQKNLKLKTRRLEDIKFDFFSDQTVTYRYFQQNNPDLITGIELFINTCKQIKINSIELINKSKSITLDSELKSPAPALENVIKSLEIQIKDLENKDSLATLNKFEREFIELHHRTVLKENWGQINEYFTNIQWAKKAKKALGTTRHITQKHNELFQLL